MLILASQSPRRKQLLSAAGFVFETVPSDIDEVIPEDAGPANAVRALAMQKAANIAKTRPGGIIIGADTVVFSGGRILGKPKDKDGAAAMLSALSGRTHEVFTGVAVVAGNTAIGFSERTEVEFYRLSESEITAYIETGEPFDKAGAYGIQEKGMLLVKRIRGDFFNVMGLPIGRLARVLRCLK